jgi:hypothetical protein
MIVHPKQLFVSCTDCRAVFYALGFGGFLPVGPLPPPPPPARVLYAAAIIIPSLYLFKGLINSAVWGRGGGGGGNRDEYIAFHMLCRLRGRGRYLCTELADDT